ncbi:hypothetical protein RYX36_024286 [Vicia faba]
MHSLRQKDPSNYIGNNISATTRNTHPNKPKKTQENLIRHPKKNLNVRNHNYSPNSGHHHNEENSNINRKSKRKDHHNSDGEDPSTSDNIQWNTTTQTQQRNTNQNLTRRINNIDRQSNNKGKSPYLNYHRCNIQINTDVSLKIHGLWGLGAVINNDEGETVEEIGWCRSGEEDPLAAEVMTMKLIVEHHNVRNVPMLTDNKTLIDIHTNNYMQEGRSNNHMMCQHILR